MNLDDFGYSKLFDSLFSDLKEEEEFYLKKPLLSHYTTLSNLESILKSNEIWLSNPLFMNDYEEVKFGMIQGLNVFESSENLLQALGGDSRFQEFINQLNACAAEFEEKNLFDTYVACFSEHELENNDGRLSMWRGYGANGSGAALVFDTSKIEAVYGSPFILAKVYYGTAPERIKRLNSYADLASRIIDCNEIPNEKLLLVARAIFERIKMFSLFTKHHGFEEEKEWRLVYLSDRDRSNKYEKMQGYYNGPRGVEPKLKFRFEEIEGLTPPDFSLEKVLNSIILGPTASAPLAIASVRRMCSILGRKELKNLVLPSQIPLRKTD